LCCSKNTPTNAERGIEEQILYVANADEPRELDPQLSTGTPEHQISSALFEGLLNRHPKTLAMTPGAAERWTLADDQLTYTFYLRKNGRWSNGDKINAHDFVYSWHRSLLVRLGSEWASMKYVIKNAEAFHRGDIDDFSQVGVKAVDDYTLSITLETPTHHFPQLLWHNSYFPVHQATIETFGAMDDRLSKWTLPGNLVGNGPFTLTRWELNKVLEVKRNTHYWDNNAVKLNGIVFYPIASQQSEVRAYRSGQIHLTYSPQMAIEKIADYQKNDPDSLRIHNGYSSYFYEFNTTIEPFTDARVRRALAYAIDRDKIVKLVTKAGEPPAYSVVAPDPNGYQAEALFGYDVAKAQQLLAEAGYPNGAGFPAAEILYNTHDNHRKVALAIQQMLRENLNIEVQLLNQEWKVYLNTKLNLQHSIARAGWRADFLDPINFFELLAPNSGNNNTGWKNQAYGEVLNAIRTAKTEQERQQLMAKANEILAEQMPVIPLYYMTDVNLVSPAVQGWYDNAMHFHPFNRVFLQDTASTTRQNNKQ